MSNDTKPGLLKTILPLTLVAILIGLIWFYYGDKPPQEPDSPPPALSQEEIRHLIELRNVGIAHLENFSNLSLGRDEAIEECITSFTALSEKLPAEPIGSRNLAITHLLVLMGDVTSLNPEELSRLYAQTKTALRKHEQAQGKSFLLHILKAKLARRAAELKLIRDTQPIIDEYTKASELSPDSPLPWTELYSAASASSSETLRATMPKALENAQKLVPDNYVLLIERLNAQLRQEDPSITETLTTAGELLKLYEATFRRNGIELSTLISEAQTAVKSDDPNRWRIVAAKVRPLINVTRPQTAYQIDSSRLEKHPLDFVVFDFSEEFYRQANLAETPHPPSVEVKFVPADATLQLPPMESVVDAQFVDFNLNGKFEVITLGQNTLQVFAIKENSGWELLTKLTLPDGMEHLLIADLDWDLLESSVAAADPSKTSDETTTPSPTIQEADLDVVVYGPGGARILRNRLDPKSRKRTLEITPQKDGVDTLKDVQSAAIVDLDHDGDLDLIVSTATDISLWSNSRNFLFENQSDRSILPPDTFTATTLLPVDWNQNIVTDVILASPSTQQAGLLQNNFHNRFRWLAFEPEFDQLKHARTLALVDADANYSWDLVSGGDNGVFLTTTRTLDSGEVQFRQQQKISDQSTQGLKTLDFDNDGYQDLVLWGDQKLTLLRGNAHGEFQAVGKLFENLPQNVTACDIGDYDGDGDEDLLIVEDGIPRLYRNDGGNNNFWIDVVLGAEAEPKFPSQRTNQHGIGSLLELKTGEHYQRRLVSHRTTHLGLRQFQQADTVRILFPNGMPQNIIRPQSKQGIYEKQRVLTGSCPYLYTWDGEKYVFFTDLLWAAPIGLQFAEGVLAVPREWEYLKIPGEKLVPKNGEYRLQITEELWEAAYFDSVELIAVDHPADVEIFSNEKVGPPEIAEFKIHTVKQPRIPISARDQKDRDILPQIRERDDRYTRTFDRRISQGLTPEHYLELDLGKLKDPNTIRLFLTGWVFPSDTSLNVAISQNPQLDSPQPPSLWVPDANGVWKKIMPFMGFPGGKTKTIAVDLSNAFLTDDYRVRIATTMEFYWDHVFFTVDETPVESRLIHMPPISAELHYRGFSRRIEHPRNGPESYDYNSVSREPIWPPMQGNFTRYGDVAELVNQDDDHLVVLGSGDELTLRFKVPAEQPPQGWKRDFLIRSVGWDKDAALHTVLGQTVEPLPFRGMSRYPLPPDESPPDNQQYRDYLRKYQTRQLNRADFWRQIQGFRPNTADHAGNPD